jgi:hypothetical protein
MPSKRGPLLLSLVKQQIQRKDMATNHNEIEISHHATQVKIGQLLINLRKLLILGAMRVHNLQSGSLLVLYPFPMNQQ